MGVPRAEASDSLRLATAEDEEITAMAPQSGPLPPPAWRGQEKDPTGEGEKGAGRPAGLPGRQRLKRLPSQSEELGARLQLTTPPPQAYIAANQ